MLLKWGKLCRTQPKLNSNFKSNILSCFKHNFGVWWFQIFTTVCHKSHWKFNLRFVWIVMSSSGISGIRSFHCFPLVYITAWSWLWLWLCKCLFWWTCNFYFLFFRASLSAPYEFCNGSSVSFLTPRVWGGVHFQRQDLQPRRQLASLPGALWLYVLHAMCLHRGN